MDDLGAPEPQRRRLGRGLNALIGSGAYSDGPTASDNDHSEVHVELIERNPFQPRQDFEQTALNELVDSIRQHGVLQPLLVRPLGDGYQLIAGERRLIAAKKAGLEIVPCRVLALSDQQVCEVSLEENLKRQDLNVLEKAAAFKDYLDRFQLPIEELARRLSLDRSTVSNMLRLLELPETIKQDVPVKPARCSPCRKGTSSRWRRRFRPSTGPSAGPKRPFAACSSRSRTRSPSPAARKRPPRRKRANSPTTCCLFRSRCATGSPRRWRSN
jgi:ParB/RepB/Spo0J family partition protein